MNNEENRRRKERESARVRERSRDVIASQVKKKRKKI